MNTNEVKQRAVTGVRQMFEFGCKKSLSCVEGVAATLFHFRYIVRRKALLPTFDNEVLMKTK